VLLLVDNRDSFTFNLAQLFAELGEPVQVERARDLTLERVRALAPGRVLLGPGPGGPDEAGPSVALVRGLAGELPLFGVCLGHQAIGRAFGARIVRARALRHGSVALVHHDGQGLFRGAPDPLRACVYHSLAVDERSLPAELEVSARDEHGDVMGLRHRELPLEGVQFHPEALRSEHGRTWARNLLERRGLAGSAT
jgi:anthranilate synthase component 2